MTETPSEHLARDDRDQSDDKDVPPGSPPAVVSRFAAALLERSESSPFAEHITSEHIDKSLDITDAQNERVRIDRRETRTHHFRVLIVGVVALLGLVALLVFSDNAGLVQDMLEWLAVGGVGWAGGYGWAKRRTS